MNNQMENLDNKKFNSNNSTNSIIDMDALIVNLKNEDSRNLKLMRNMKWMYFILIFVYSLLMVVNPDSDLNLHHRISGICYVLAFAYFALIFRKFHKEYSTIDYSLPIFEMLTKAVKRHKMTVSNFLLALPPVLLINIGVSLTEFYRPSSIDPLNRVLIFQAILIPIIVISGYIGYLIWKKRQKPLRDGALQMLKDLEN